MGKLFIPSERNIEGPWFIGGTELEDLNEIFEFAFSRINSSIEAAKKEQAKVDVENGKYESIEIALKGKRFLEFDLSKKVELSSKNGKKLIDDSIIGILKDAKLIDFEPTDLTLEIKSGHTRYFYLKITNRYEGGLSYNLEFFDQDCCEEIIYKVENWLDRYKPKKVYSIWSQYSSGICFFAVLLMIIFSSLIIKKELPDYKSIHKSEINKIIKEGVNRENEGKAVELLLKYSTDYHPENIKAVTKINKRAAYLFILSLIILFLGIFKPITIIGIGKHKALSNRYKVYLKFIVFTIPAVFIFPLIFDWIKSLIG